MSRTAQKGRGAGVRRGAPVPRQLHSTKPVRPSHHTGRIALTSRGVGYIAIEGFPQDIEIQRERLNTALDGDEVEIELLPHRHGERQQGSVVRIIERAREEFVGVVAKDARGYFLMPDNRRVYTPFLIPPEEAERHRLASNLKVLVRLGEWRDPLKNPTAHIVRVLGEKGLHETEMEAVLAGSGFNSLYPSEAAAEAQEIKRSAAISAADIGTRRDFRDTLTFTIDPADAKDFDDALSVREREDGCFEIGIHIADVSHYVRPASALDREAAERATSVYLVDRTIPMLPPELSDDLCSLNPDEDKLVFSVLFLLNQEAHVRERWFGRGIIHSNRRFSYEEAQQQIADVRKEEGGELSSEHTPYPHALAALNALAKKLKQRRVAAGAIEFEEPEVRFTLDKDKRPIAAVVKERLEAHQLIEEFMLLANREVAELIGQSGRGKDVARPFLYRVHDAPDPEKIEELAVFLRAIGHELDVPKTGSVRAKDLNALFSRLEGHAAESLVKKAALRAMAKAVYTTANIGHYGLAFGYYTHFTSPIRRYPDVLVHRLLARYLARERVGQDELAALRAHALHASARERAAMDAERASVKYKQVEFLSTRVGEEFDALVSGVTEWGIYVEEKTSRAEGMIALRSLTDDYYELDAHNYRMVGSRTKRAFSLGEKLRVRLVGADLDRRTLDFVPVSSTKIA
ncbi:MAG: ribonuclease R [bacterium]|nr:ribonuclease R [bacterium]MDZ4284504.1 ribonuclease R [Patescibacteria group bacterium]